MTFFSRLQSAPAHIRLALLCAALIFAGLASTSFGQEPAPAAATPAPAAEAAPGPFAPGVLTTIAPDMSPDETVSTHDLVEFRADPSLNWNPEFLAASRTLSGMSQGVKFRREVSCLEFSFKPLRMISVDVPQASGQMQKKLIMYMVYRVRNTGQVLKPVAKEEGSAFAAEIAPGQPLRFLPHFVLESQDRLPTGEQVDKSYLDRVIPVAVDAIRRREMRGQPLFNSVEMAQRMIPVSTDRLDRSVWGVATWEDVDPRIDFFSVYVGGLSNAYGWEDNPAAARPGMQPGSGRTFLRKTLQLNFWRAGDEMLQDEREIRYGVPVGKSVLYGVADGVAYRWVYR
jgi:hypothetical protein